MNSKKKLAAVSAATILAGLGVAGTAQARVELSYRHLGSAAQVRTELLAVNGAAPLANQDDKEGEEGKCGEGKCGEGKCGEGKCGDGGDKGDTEGKCGEGKCGS